MKNNQIQDTLEFARLVSRRHEYTPRKKTPFVRSMFKNKPVASSLILIIMLAACFGIASTVLAATAPIVHLSSPNNVLINENTEFIASYESSNGISSCKLYIDNINKGNMNISGDGSTGSATLTSYVFTEIPGPNSYSAQVHCTDLSGQIGVSNIIPITVTTLSPVVGAIFPMSATVLDAKNYYASYTSVFSVTNCSLYADGLWVDNMTLSGTENSGSATQHRYFTTAGNHTLQARCTDSAGNIGSGSITTISVANAEYIDNTPSDEFSLAMMSNDAAFITTRSNRSDFEANIRLACEIDTHTASVKTADVLGNITNDSVRTMIENFVACGTPTSLHLGSGERLGVVNSYSTAFGRLPATQAQWNDVLKIANGRFTTEKSASAEIRAEANFLKVYLRDNNTALTSDNNAIAVMAYGLRPLPRNLNSERAAIETFKSVYGRMPTSSSDWNIVRPIAYSGATRNQGLISQR